MSHELPDPHPERSQLSDRAVSYLRTGVPVAWGALVSLLLQLLAGVLPEHVTATVIRLLESELVLALVTAAVIFAWYWVWRRLEPYVPDWVVTIVLGHSKPPVYAPTSADGTRVITSLDVIDQIHLGHVHDALPPGDPGRTAIAKVLDTTRRP